MIFWIYCADFVTLEIRKAQAIGQTKCQFQLEDGNVNKVALTWRWFSSYAEAVEALTEHCIRDLQAVLAL
jgi:hypothetical protein